MLYFSSSSSCLGPTSSSPAIICGPAFSTCGAVWWFVSTEVAGICSALFCSSNRRIWLNRSNYELITSWFYFNSYSSFTNAFGMASLCAGLAYWDISCLNGLLPLGAGFRLSKYSLRFRTRSSSALSSSEASVWFYLVNFPPLWEFMLLACLSFLLASATSIDDIVCTTLALAIGFLLYGIPFSSSGISYSSFTFI